MYSIQSRNFDFRLLSCGFRRMDLDDMCKEPHGELLKELLKQKERISYIYENGLSHVYIATRNEFYPESRVPNILRSRASMKLFEIMQNVDISCKSFLDICAGPGAMSDLLLKSFECTGLGVSLCQEDTSKHFYDDLTNNDKYNIASPDDGDITRIEVISDVASMSDAIYGKYGVDLIVADGAPSLDFNQEDYQEVHAQKILLGEIITGLECLKRHGTFIMKIFDTFTKFSRCVVYLFTKLFNSLKIIKPASSRITNSEKYLVGMDLMIVDDKRVDLLAQLHTILYNFKDGYNCEEFISLDRDSRFEQTFGASMTKLAQNQIESLKVILNQIDFKIFKVELPEPPRKGKGKGKGRKGKGKRSEPYVAPPPPQLAPEKEYSPFEEDSLFPD